MAPPDILILAVTRMRSGVCIAGMSGAADTATGLRWIRPVKQRGRLHDGHHWPLVVGVHASGMPEVDTVGEAL